MVALYISYILIFCGMTGLSISFITNRNAKLTAGSDILEMPSGIRNSILLVTVGSVLLFVNVFYMLLANLF